MKLNTTPNQETTIPIIAFSMKIACLYFFVCLGLIFTPKHTFSQKHFVELSLSPTHYYFDETPLFNKHCGNNKKTAFFDKLNDSYTINYAYQTRKQLFIRLSFDWFLTNYLGNLCERAKPLIGSRSRMIWGLSAGHNLQLNNKFTFNYGGGIDLQFGHDVVFLESSPIGNELFSEGYIKKDLGFHIFTGLNYELTTHLYLTSRIDYWNVIYFGDKEQQKRFKDDNLLPFPTRYDLSFSIGVGLNLFKSSTE